MANADSNTVDPMTVIFSEVNTAKWNCMMLNPLLEIAINNLLESSPESASPEARKSQFDELVALLDASRKYSKMLLENMTNIENIEFNVITSKAEVHHA